MDYRDIITIEPGKRSGQPCIRGLRMTVQDVLEYLKGSMSKDEILDEFPDLTRADIRECVVAKEQSTPEKFALLAIVEKLSSVITVEYLEERANRAKLERLAQLLAKVQDVEPEENDRL